MEVPPILLNRILSEAAKKGATSLHLSVGSAPILRIDGNLRLMENEEILTTDILEKMIKSFLNDEELTKLTQEKELVIAKTFAGNFRFRVNIYYQRTSPSISFNFVSGVIKNLDELNFPKELVKLLNYNSGLLIVAGPDNSGKTSTAATFIEEINKTKKNHIITLEDPIEYVFINKESIIEQRQVGQDVISYQKGLEHCLNEDVDVVYIDEIKKDFDKLVPQILELASGNSLVILEMNADTVIRVIEKILSSNNNSKSSESIRYNLSDVLAGIICQRLIPKRGGGMAMANEILIATQPVKSLIREGKIFQLESILETSRGEGMTSMKKAIDELVSMGTINKDEADKLNLA